MTPLKAQLESDLVEEARANLRLSISQLLLASRGSSPVAVEAAQALAAALVQGAEAIRTELGQQNRAFRKILAYSTTWPVRWLPFTHDRDKVAEELQEMGFGTAAELNLSHAFAATPGNRWAVTFFSFVNTAQALRNERTVELIADPTARGVMIQALELPRLTRNALALKAWGAAAAAYFNYHFPGDILSNHPDWRNVRKHRSNVDPKRLRKSIHRYIRDGLRQIAPEALRK